MHDGIAVDLIDGGEETFLELLFRRDANMPKHRECEFRGEALDEIEP